MSSLDRDRAFDAGQLQQLQSTGIQMMNSFLTEVDEAESIISSLQGLCSELGALEVEDVLSDALNACRVGLKREGFLDYRRALNKLLMDLMDLIPSIDKTAADKMEDNTIATRSLIIRIKALITMIGSGAFEGDVNILRQKIFNLQKIWEVEGISLQEKIDKLANELKGLNLSCCLSGGDPVNLATGNFIYEREDLKLNGRIPISFKRTYNSVGAKDSILGFGWIHNEEGRLDVSKENRLIRTGADGKEETFLRKDGHIFAGRLEQSAFIEEIVTDEAITAYHYTNLHEQKCIYNSEGKKIRQEDMNGNYILYHYNELDQLSTIETSDGNTLSYTYDEQGQLIAVTDHTGRAVKFVYRDNRIRKAIQADGAIYTYTYGMNGDLISVRNSKNIEMIRNSFDGNHRVTKQTFPDGGVMKFTYQDEAQKVIVTEQNGNQIIYLHDDRYRNIKTIYSDGEESYSYNDRNQRISYTDQNGNTVKYRYDAQGNLIQQIEPNSVITSAAQSNTNGKKMTLYLNHHGEVTQIERPDHSKEQIYYDKRGNIISYCTSSGSVYRYEYDHLNRVTRTIDGKGNQTNYRYDVNDRIVEVINAAGDQRTYLYTETGKIKEIRDFDGSSLRQEYNAMEQPECMIDQNGHATRYQYDQMWKMTELTDAIGAVTHYMYNLRGRMIKVTNAMGAEWDYDYDPNGNCISERTPEGTLKEYKYDSCSRLVEIYVNEKLYRKYTYDNMGRKIREEGQGVYTQTEYDAEGRIIRNRNSQGREIEYTYTVLGKPESIIERFCQVGDIKNRKIMKENIRRYYYEKGGRLHEEVLPTGDTITYCYDANGNIIEKKYASGACYYYEYDCLNQMILEKDSEGNQKTYTYDALGRQISHTDTRGNTTKYAYSPTGMMTLVEDALGGRTEYFYDAADRLIKVNRNGQTEEYKRNLLGEIESVTDALGNQENYLYDQEGNLTKKIDQEGNEILTECDVKLQYEALQKLEDIKGIIEEKDSFGRDVKRVFPNGTETKYTYTLSGRIETLINKDQKGTLDSYLYKYDGEGNCIELKKQRRDLPEDSGTYRYTYDALNRLQDVYREDRKVRAYAYDLSGNRTGMTEIRDHISGISDEYHTTYEYNKAGQLVQLNSLDYVQTYLYDKRGNLIQVDGDDGNHIQYEYDQMGNLSLFRDGLTEYHYLYNELGQRTKKIIRNYEKNNIHETAEEVEYIQNPFYEYHSICKIKRGKDVYSYLWKNSIVGMVKSNQEEKTISYYLTDRMGSPIRKINEKGGLEEAYIYDEFGKMDRISCEINADNKASDIIGFTGYVLEENGTYQAQARYYHPRLGRFLSRDCKKGSQVNPLSQNAYVYVMNRPLTFVDLNGCGPTQSIFDTCNYPWKRWIKDESTNRAPFMSTDCPLSQMANGTISDMSGSANNLLYPVTMQDLAKEAFTYRPISADQREDSFANWIDDGVDYLMDGWLGDAYIFTTKNSKIGSRCLYIKETYDGLIRGISEEQSNQESEDFIRGMYGSPFKMAGETINGLVMLVDTMEALTKSVEQQGFSQTGRDLWFGVKRSFNNTIWTAQYGSPRQKGELSGRALIEIALAVQGAAEGISKIQKVSQAKKLTNSLKAAENIGDVTELAVDFEKIESLQNIVDTPLDEIVEGGLNSLSEPSSKALRQNMIDAGVDVPEYANAAHHIAAGSSPKAAEARAILQKYGIDINAAENGVFLPTVKDVADGAYHPSLHTNAYYNEINKQLLKAKSKDDVLSILEDISEQLTDGIFMK